MILGVYVLVRPGISILVAATLFGLYLLITGIAHVIFAFALDVSAGSRPQRSDPALIAAVGKLSLGNEA